MRGFLNFLNKIFFRGYRLFLFSLSIITIIYFFPIKGKFKYDFEKGRPWQYENLYAPFDFTLKKTQEEINEEFELTKIKNPIFFNIDSFATYNILDKIKLSIEYLEKDSILAQTDTINFKKLDSLTRIIFSDIYKKGLLDLNYDFSDEQISTVLIDNEEINSTYFNEFIKPEELFKFVENKILEFQAEDLGPQIIWLVSEISTPNIKLNNTLTEKSINEVYNSISSDKSSIEKETLIISKGEIVDDKTLQILQSLKHDYEMNSDFDNINTVYLAYSVLLILSILMIVMYLRKFEISIYQSNNKLTFIYFNLSLLIIISTYIINTRPDYIYIVPYSLLPLLFMTFFNSGIALICHSIAILLIGFIAPYSYEFIFLNIMTGIVAILSSKNIYKRSNLFLTVIKITCVYILCYVSFHVIKDGTLSEIKISNVVVFLICGLLTLFIYPLIYIYEKIFRLVSDVSLLELSDTNSGLLKKLSEEAPGTFHRSLNVANLAEACADKIGANALLSRVGALHHDIGKIKNPEYFIENQKINENIHDNITATESVKIIKNHVHEGVKLGKSEGLPERVIDFISTHHGTSLISFFYNQEKESNPNVLKSDFCYNGPKPFSIEMAIVMMCDSVEAATKSIKDPDSKKIDEFVESIIDKQVENNQYENCELTFKNISTIKNILKEKLKNIYHIRIEYPR